MPEIESPCLSCVLKNYSKDNPTCKDCDARCDYIKIIDGASPATLVRPVIKRASTAKLKQAELYIQEYCEKHFIALEDLKSRRFSGGLSEARAVIAYKLRHEYVLSLKDIGKLLGKTQQAISVILKPKVTKSAKTVSIEEGVIPLTRTPAGDLSVKAEDCHGYTTDLPPVQPIRETELDSKKFIILDFKEYQDLYNHVIKTAKANFRKPEDHILYLINKEREGPDECNKALQADKKEL